MKKAIILCSSLIIAVALLGCDDDDETRYAAGNGIITFSQTELTADVEGATFTVTVETEGEFIAYTDDDWITVSPESSISTEETLTITVEANEDTDERTGYVTVNALGTRKSITVVQAGVPEEEIEAPEGYVLVWNDEFEDDELGGDWTYEVQSAGWVNNELQNYVKDDDVVEVSDGTLKINVVKDGDDVNSARIYAKNSTGWQYGYFEASIKLPTGVGTWPAFWMMPVNYTAWPDDGEIDIMEEVGYNPNVVVSTIHCNKYNNTGTSIETASRTVSTAQTEFHTYSMEWTEEYMTFYVDGEELLTYENDGTGTDAWPFDANFYIILNVAWGGSWGGAEGVDEDALPATMEVDYVRVFQKE